MQAFPDPAGVPASLTRQGLAARWWVVLVRGLVAIVFGVVAFTWPGLTILTLVLFYGAFVLADGILAIAAAISGRGPSQARWWLVLSGVLGILLGLVAFVFPAAVALVLLFLIAAWSIVTGVMEVVAAIQLRKEIEHEWLLIVSGVLSVLFGLVLMALPVAGALAIVWLIAAYAIVSGIVYVTWALRLRSMNGRGTPQAA